MTALRIQPVATRKDLLQFIQLPWHLYRDDPAWVPPLLQERLEFFDHKKNPYFEHAEVGLFLAWQNGQVVGRISAQVDRLVQQHIMSGLGQWGLLECIDDPAVAHALIATAETWLRARGMTRAQGPISMSIWDEPGLLVDGFDRTPVLMTGHHLPYYQPLIENAGYTGVKNLWAYELDITKEFPPRIQKIVAAGAANPRIVIRDIRMKDVIAEGALIADILNDAWSSNWGYVPLTDREKRYVVQQWRKLVVPSWVKIAEYDGVPVGFMLTLPDLNEWIADYNGKLFPFNFIKLLMHLRSKRVQRVRVPIMGVRKPFQTSRLGAQLAFMMIEYTRRDGVKHGAQWAELGWILDDNDGMNSILRAILSQVYKTYRVYERDL